MSKSKYPFADLKEVGDKAEFMTNASVNAVRVGACLYGKRHGVKLSVGILSANECEIGEAAGTINRHYLVERVA